MSISNPSWLHAYLQLRDRALLARGPHIDDGGRACCPHTIGGDVLAIASVIDPIMREQALGYFGHALYRRWERLLDELAEHALVALDDEYERNGSFWGALPAICAYLHAERAPLPDDTVWAALLDQLAMAPGLRNVGPKEDGPFAHFDGIKTYDDLYRAQYVYLRDKRGADEKAPPPGQMGTSYPIPRTTNADVIQLATYWSTALAKVKHVDGHEAIAAKWQVALGDVEKLAKSGKADAVYAKNNEFWREMKRVAIQVAVSDEAPTKWDMLVDSVKDSITHLPDHLAEGAKKVAHEVADLAAGAANTVGKIANEAGKGLFSGFGTPLLIGAGLVGLFLITRGRDHDREEA